MSERRGGERREKRQKEREGEKRGKRVKVVVSMEEKYRINVGRCTKWIQFPFYILGKEK